MIRSLFVLGALAILLGVATPAQAELVSRSQKITSDRLSAELRWSEDTGSAKPPSGFTLVMRPSGPEAQEIAFGVDVRCRAACALSVGNAGTGAGVAFQHLYTDDPGLAPIRSRRIYPQVVVALVATYADGTRETNLSLWSIQDNGFCGGADLYLAMAYDTAVRDIDGDGRVEVVTHDNDLARSFGGPADAAPAIVAGYQVNPRQHPRLWAFTGYPHADWPVSKAIEQLLIADRNRLRKMFIAARRKVRRTHSATDGRVARAYFAGLYRAEERLRPLRRFAHTFDVVQEIQRGTFARGRALKTSPNRAFRDFDRRLKVSRQDDGGPSSLDLLTYRPA